MLYGQFFMFRSLTVITNHWSGSMNITSWMLALCSHFWVYCKKCVCIGATSRLKGIQRDAASDKMMTVLSSLLCSSCQTKWVPLFLLATEISVAKYPFTHGHFYPIHQCTSTILSFNTFELDQVSTKKLMPI